MNQESELTKDIMLELSRRKATVFRNNTGMGWIGQQIFYPKPGYVLLKNPRPLHAGLCTGSSDVIGWKPVVITEDMVGKTLAVFTAVEVKTARGKATKEQLNFIERLREAGGIAGIARTPEEARNLLENYVK